MSTMTRLIVGGAVAAAVLPRLAAADEEALDAEFLDYLDTLEGEREDWTWFSDKADSEAEIEADAERATEDAGR